MHKIWKGFSYGKVSLPYDQFLEMEIVEEPLKKMVDENSRKTMNQKEYSKKYNELVERYKKLKMS
ncbi:hypothetical protein AAGC94_16100 [Clostridium sporogenes]|jgi:hypothetical protein|uniref:hypothetical protein n=1 Tax=Clostridium TaxID=1485 RepID=UPI00156E5A00|nr:hypothetical protein [Clostridium cochlearium]MBV1820065.1 hypothetical protein [Bacteroidales bacterium MSK.15.36]MCG4580932.1 hypothetical protein [Clostridium cochlearium]NSJ91782.1 hypothetical protein [Coprococcus sp. MSK.21.13]